MKSSSRIVLCLFALVFVAGCASTNVTQQTPMVNKGMARPNQIWVYNFVQPGRHARRFLDQR